MMVNGITFVLHGKTALARGTSTLTENLKTAVPISRHITRSKAEELLSLVKIKMIMAMHLISIRASLARCMVSTCGAVFYPPTKF